MKIEDIAREWATDYKPFEDNLTPQKYAEFGFIQGYRASQGNNKKWINVADQMPEIGQECWAVDKNKKLYLVSVRKALLSDKRVFFNMIGRGWDVHDIIKWQPVIFPDIDEDTN